MDEYTEKFNRIIENSNIISSEIESLSIEELKYMLKRCEESETIAPLINPSLYMLGRNTLDTTVKIFRALIKIKETGLCELMNKLQKQRKEAQEQYNQFE